MRRWRGVIWGLRLTYFLIFPSICPLFKWNTFLFLKQVMIGTKKIKKFYADYENWACYFLSGKVHPKQCKKFAVLFKVIFNMIGISIKIKSFETHHDILQAKQIWPFRDCFCTFWYHKIEIREKLLKKIKKTHMHAICRFLIYENRLPRLYCTAVR